MIQTMRNDKTGESVARTIVQNVKVTAVGQRHQEGQDPGNRSITVLVTPQQAELLQLACATGRPYMSLRSGNDLSLVETRRDDHGNDRNPERPSRFDEPYRSGR